MMCDSTNVDRPGFTGSEREVEDAFEELFTGTEGKLVVGAFSSSLYRLQILVDLAVQFDRSEAIRHSIDDVQITLLIAFGLVVATSPGMAMSSELVNSSAMVVERANRRLTTKVRPRSSSPSR